MPPLVLVQGIDLVAGGRNKKTHRTAPKSDNVYLKLLVKVCITVHYPAILLYPSLPCESLLSIPTLRCFSALP